MMRIPTYITIFVNSYQKLEKNMLIEFSVTNFRSIREKQTLSLAKSKLKESEQLSENSFQCESANMDLLRSSAVYGANASGKSNLLQALRVMKKIVMDSATDMQHGDELPVEPFRLSAASRNGPTEFEVTFLNQNIRYQYGFSATSRQILEEWLIAYPKGRAQHWFARLWDPETRKYQWQTGNNLTGQKQLWMNATRPNALFLSTAVQLNSQQLLPVFEWFDDMLHITGIQGWGPGYTALLCRKNSHKTKIMQFLHEADIDINDVMIEEELFDRKALPDFMPEEARTKIIEELEGKKMLKSIKTLHTDDNGETIEFDLDDDESQGTRKLFSFAGPWLDSLEKGNVLFIDELHDNLHPSLVRFLVGLFMSNVTNPHNAQLVFTTHETSILDMFRRDQIWFCEKNDHHATQLVPLTDFSPRNRENLEQAYLSGRFGAIPYIRELTEAL